MSEEAGRDRIQRPELAHAEQQAERCFRLARMVGDPEIMRRLDRLGERYLAESRALASVADASRRAGST